MQGEHNLLKHGPIVLTYDNEPSPIALSQSAQVRIVTSDGHTRFDRTFLDGLLVRRDPAKLVVEGDAETAPVVFAPLDRSDKVFIFASKSVAALQ